MDFCQKQITSRLSNFKGGFKILMFLSGSKEIKRNWKNKFKVVLSMCEKNLSSITRSCNWQQESLNEYPFLISRISISLREQRFVSSLVDFVLFTKTYQPGSFQRFFLLETTFLFEVDSQNDLVTHGRIDSFSEAHQ